MMHATIFHYRYAVCEIIKKEKLLFNNKKQYETVKYQPFFSTHAHKFCLFFNFERVSNGTEGSYHEPFSTCIYGVPIVFVAAYPTNNIINMYISINIECIFMFPLLIFILLVSHFSSMFSVLLAQSKNQYRSENIYINLRCSIRFSAYGLVNFS